MKPFSDGGRLISNSETLFLTALFNSFALQFILRLKVNNNLSFFILYELPVPRLAPSDAAFGAIMSRAAKLTCTAPDFADLARDVGLGSLKNSATAVNERITLRAELDALIAQLYRFTEEEFAHVLSTFPLVPSEAKTLTLNTFRAMLPSADDETVHKLIKVKETEKVELKEGAAYSTQRSRKSPDMIRNVLRELAGFLNSGGGNVILGVTDKGKVVGIADDLQHADPKKKNRDGYELFLRNSISGKLGTIQSSSCKISFHKIDNLEVCRIFVPASPTPVYLDGDLIIRDGTSSRSLSAQETADYVGLHWPQV